MPRPRKPDPTIPAHIDQAKIPAGVYWDRSGKGRWFVFEVVDGRKRRKTIAGAAARLSDLHAIAEHDTEAGSVAWMCGQYHASSKFRKLAASTRADYEYSRDVLLNFPTSIGLPFGRWKANQVRSIHLQRMIDKIDAEGHPTKANKVLRYARLVWRWACNRLAGIQQNPARGLEGATERKLQRVPEQDAYTALLQFARERGARKPRTAGSVAPYLWLVMELGYLCRLRGIETLTLVEAQAEKEGLRTRRRKRSRDNLVEWTPRLRAVWNAALELRKATRGTAPELLRAEDRVVFLAEGGEPLSKSGLDSAWQRLVKLAIKESVITREQRFSPHDLKRKGGTDTPGTSADKKDALGVTDAMLKVYDKSVPLVKPSA